MTGVEQRKLLAQYNSLYKDMDEVYRALARHYGLSDCALWILYSLREADDALTQNKLCGQLSLSKQTVNSALKKLEKEGIIRLVHEPGNHKNKLIQLTARGERLSEETIDHVMQMEQAAFEQFAAGEAAVYLHLHQKYVRGLQSEAEKITMGIQGL